MILLIEMIQKMMIIWCIFQNNAIRWQTNIWRLTPWDRSGNISHCIILLSFSGSFFINNIIKWYILCFFDVFIEYWLIFKICGIVSILGAGWGTCQTSTILFICDSGFSQFLKCFSRIFCVFWNMNLVFDTNFFGFVFLSFISLHTCEQNILHHQNCTYEVDFCFFEILLCFWCLKQNFGFIFQGWNLRILEQNHHIFFLMIIVLVLCGFYGTFWNWSCVWTVEQFYFWMFVVFVIDQTHICFKKYLHTSWT